MNLPQNIPSKEESYYTQVKFLVQENSFLCGLKTRSLASHQLIKPVQDFVENHKQHTIRFLTNRLEFVELSTKFLEKTHREKFISEQFLFNINNTIEDKQNGRRLS